MRVRREAAARLRLAAEVLEVRLVDPAFEVRARINARRGVALEVDDVAVAGGVAGPVAAEEMVEADLVQRRRFRFVRAHDHCSSVPADQALDAALEVGTAGHECLVVSGNGVDIRGVGGERNLDAVFRGVERQLAKQALNFDRSAALQHIIKRVEPLARLGLIEVCRVFR